MSESAPGTARRAPGRGRGPWRKFRFSNPWFISWLGAIRVRLALLVLIAAVPLLMLAATIAWQNYQLALGATTETALRLREAAIARHVAAITGAEQMMQALSQVSELTSGDAARCQDRLAGLLLLQKASYSNLAVIGADGLMRCSARPVPGIAPGTPAISRVAALLPRARTQRGLVLGPLGPSLVTGGKIIPAIYPILRNGVVDSYVYAGLHVDWFASPPGTHSPILPALWIVDGSGMVSQIAGEGTIGLPAPAILKRLEEEPLVVDAASEGGKPYAYASSTLGENYSLIVAYPATLDREAARSVLIHRVAQLGLLLLVGLAAVAFGAHTALVEPLTQLSQAVANWRTTGTFDPAIIADPPTEIRGLAASFAAATQALADHEARHRVAVEQQELLMREIHHRVKNNLQIVASLLNLQASRIRVPEARAEFASARDRVRALATLHRHLYAHGEVHTIDMPVFLKELCGQLFAAMGETAGERIDLTIEASPLQMSSDQAVPLSLIVTEAVSNALKYAFPRHRTGRVRVCLSSDAEMTELVVEDDGVGIPAGQSETDAGPRDGIGLTLIRGFARQLGGELTVQANPGTKYTLRMKTHRDVEQADIAA